MSGDAVVIWLQIAGIVAVLLSLVVCPGVLIEKATKRAFEDAALEDHEIARFDAFEPSASWENGPKRFVRAAINKALIWHDGRRWLVTKVDTEGNSNRFLVIRGVEL